MPHQAQKPPVLNGGSNLKMTDAKTREMEVRAWKIFSKISRRGR